MTGSMHDLRWIRENPADFDRGLKRRGLLPRAAEILAMDQSWRAAETQVQEAQARRNRVAREIGAAKKRGEDITPLLRQTTEDREIESRAGAEAAGLRERIDEILAGLPNLP